MRSSQKDLFAATPTAPECFAYAEDFLSTAEEDELLSAIRALTLEEAPYKQWTAKRRIVSYGGHYDFESNELLPAAAIPSLLHGLRTRVAAFCAAPAEAFEHALIAEYRPGTQLGWHRDVPEFELVAGVSLLGTARMRFRRYPHVTGSRARAVTLDLAPRSVYSLRGPARWDWQHAISPTRELRYSITFRTRRR